ncbi:hypothetical protein R1flu_024436 [Riccia fluitans]|uniref:Expansin-like EG45 domain-containing protein n=1 Tax=Riccia fluitans TaxID=41844 RepID=A0ABD1XUX7_9MARC
MECGTDDWQRYLHDMLLDPHSQPVLSLCALRSSVSTYLASCVDGDEGNTEVRRNDSVTLPPRAPSADFGSATMRSCDANKCGGGGGGGGGGGSTGRASYYTAPYVPSACFGYDQGQFPASGYFAAAGDGNPNIWSNGGNCGKVYKIKCTGNGCKHNNPIDVKVVDRCPNGCSGGRAFDLSYDAFNAIANPDVGVITVVYS